MAEQATFYITTGTNDGRTKRFDAAVYPPTSGDAALMDTNQTFLQTYNTFNAGYDLSESLLRWDTSTLPENIRITAAVFRVWYTGGGSNCTLYADWYNAASAIAAADWIDIGSSPHSASAGMDVDSFSNNSFVDMTLLNPDANINRSGWTGLRLICIPDTQPPVGDNTIFFAAYDHATLPEPRLLITYELSTQIPLARLGRVGA